MVFFAVLPWGIRRAGDEALGHDAGAPVRARIGLKAAVTTGIALVLFGVAYWLVDQDISRSTEGAALALARAQ
ncbi:MAG: DUF1467 family protein [Alphaproteobacteria bacterium]